jgi:WhiB family transcriptional regulator, redox-sensing transcriptional regulator
MASSLILLTTRATALNDPLPCRRENPQLWFSNLPADLELAKAYCQPCPMRRVCLSGAVERLEPHGVWGGEIFSHGAIITQKRPRGRPPSATPIPSRVHSAQIRGPKPKDGTWA